MFWQSQVFMLKKFNISVYFFVQEKLDNNQKWMIFSDLLPKFEEKHTKLLPDYYSYTF